jgi:hypothetical protein
MWESVRLTQRDSNEEQLMAGSSHGHNPAAWTGATVTFIGFCISGVATVAVNLVAFWGGIVVTLLGGVIGLAMRAAGMGAPKESPELTRARNAAANKQVHMRSEDIRAHLLARTESHEPRHESVEPAAVPVAGERQSQTA